MGRSSVKESYEKIFEDLDYAIQYGPRFYSKYRSCATTAKAFKADILMNRGEEGDYAEAIRLANEVIASDEFGLEDKYEDIFTNGYSSKELMFTRHIRPHLVWMITWGACSKCSVVQPINRQRCISRFCPKTINVMKQLSIP